MSTFFFLRQVHNIPPIICFTVVLLPICPKCALSGEGGTSTRLAPITYNANPTNTIARCGFPEVRIGPPHFNCQSTQLNLTEQGKGTLHRRRRAHTHASRVVAANT